MIVGRGDIATLLQQVDNNPNRLYFASGVSNSQETREEEYLREINLLGQQDFNKHGIYFSSLGVFTTDTRYFQHKRQMEGLIKSHFNISTIVRIGNITWGSNPHTLINNFRNNLKEGEPMMVKDVYRYVVNEDEFLHWVGQIPEWSCEMNIPGERLKVSEIVQKYVYNTR